MSPNFTNIFFLISFFLFLSLYRHILQEYNICLNQARKLSVAVDLHRAGKPPPLHLISEQQVSLYLHWLVTVFATTRDLTAFLSVSIGQCVVPIYVYLWYHNLKNVWLNVVFGSRPWITCMLFSKNYIQNCFKFLLILMQLYGMCV